MQDKTYAYTWDGVLLFAPRELSNTAHAHFPATLLMGVDGPIALTIEGKRRHYDVALIAPNVNRQTDTEGRPVVDLLIDPDDDAYRYLHPLLGGQLVVALESARLGTVRERFADIFRGHLDCRSAAQFVTDTLHALCPEPLPALPWDARVTQATRYLRRRVPGNAPTAAEVAEHVGLSESRFGHLFSEQLGLPLRQYLLWLRLRQAARLWAQGKSLSEVALGAGFYDHAHFTRTLRRMTDYAPSMLKDPRSVVRCDCADAS